MIDYVVSRVLHVSMGLVEVQYLRKTDLDTQGYQKENNNNCNQKQENKSVFRWNKQNMKMQNVEVQQGRQRHGHYV